MVPKLTLVLVELEGLAVEQALTRLGRVLLVRPDREIEAATFLASALAVLVVVVPVPPVRTWGSLAATAATVFSPASPARQSFTRVVVVGSRQVLADRAAVETALMLP